MFCGGEHPDCLLADPRSAKPDPVAAGDGAQAALARWWRGRLGFAVGEARERFTLTLQVGARLFERGEPVEEIAFSVRRRVRSRGRRAGTPRRRRFGSEPTVCSQPSRLLAAERRVGVVCIGAPVWWLMVMWWPARPPSELPARASAGAKIRSASAA